MDLAEQLRLWFRRTERATNTRKHRWSADPVGQVLREELMATGNWKNAPRGNPRKGMAAIQAARHSG